MRPLQFSRKQSHRRKISRRGIPAWLRWNLAWLTDEAGAWAQEHQNRAEMVDK